MVTGASTFRASVQVWPVKHYLSAYVSALGTNWDFIWPPAAEARIYLVVSLQEQCFIKMVGLTRQKCGESPLLLCLLWFLRFFHVSWKPLEKLLWRNHWWWRSNLHVLLIFSHAVSSNNIGWVTGFWQAGWAESTQKPLGQKLMFFPLGRGSTAIAWAEGSLW